MSISPSKNILRKENYPLRRSSVQENLSINKTSESFKKGFRNSFSRFSLRKKPAKEAQGLETKTNEYFKKVFRNSFRRLSLKKKPIKETQDSEIKVDKGLSNLYRRQALLEGSNEFLKGLDTIKKEQGLDRRSSEQSPSIAINQQLKGDYLLMKPVPVMPTPKMWVERIQSWIKELEKPKFDDSGYQCMN